MDGVPEVFHQYPLHLDASTKAISSPSLTSDVALQNELNELNALHRQIVALETPQQMIPPPTPVNPKRSAQITKMGETAAAASKKGNYKEAIGLYDLAIKMAEERPPWEASGLAREELSTLFGARAQNFMALQQWADGAVDAELALEMKKVGNTKAWMRRAQCLREMGRKEEALECVRFGLDYERPGPDKVGVAELETYLKELEK